MKQDETNEESRNRATPVPAHQRVYMELRALILFGEIAPGQPVTIQGLVDRLAAGMTPVREAIRRLTAEGALEFRGNRRVSVPVLSPSNIDELIYARLALEPQLAERATKKAKPVDLKALQDIDTELDRAIASGDVRRYLEMNFRFHARVFDMAQAPILAALAEGLWLRFGPSLRAVCGRIGTQNLPDRHKEILLAMRAGDAEAAARAMAEDVAQGMDQMSRALGAGLSGADSD